MDSYLNNLKRFRRGRMGIMYVLMSEVTDLIVKEIFLQGSIPRVWCKSATYSTKPPNLVTTLVGIAKELSSIHQPTREKASFSPSPVYVESLYVEDVIDRTLLFKYPKILLQYKYFLYSCGKRTSKYKQK